MKLSKLASEFYFTILFLYMIFGRSFSGVGIFGFRIGELLIAICLIFSFFYFPFGKLKIFKNNFVFDRKILILSKLFIVSFLVTVFLTSGNFTDTYTYRSSSIIWSINFIFFGYFFFKNIDSEHLFFKALPFVPIVLYILSTIHFPEILINFFTTYSDVFDFVKGSDLLLAFIGTMLFTRNKYKDSFFGFSYFLIVSSLFIPLFIYKSKGAFFPGLLFIVFNLFFFRKFIFNNKLKTLFIVFISIFVFLVSTFNSYGNLTFKKAGMDQVTQPDNILKAVPDAFSYIISEKNTSEIFFSFFVYKGRLYSQEQMANWRLQIWQDVVRDLFYYSNYYQDEETYSLVREQLERRNDIFFTGFGYNSILPAMNHWERTGTDGTNENPHNFYIYALGRGGILLASLVLCFHVLLIIYWKQKFKNYQILLFMLPVLFAASFDAAMESVRFPFIYYSFFGYLINNNIKKAN